MNRFSSDSLGHATVPPTYGGVPRWGVRYYMIIVTILCDYPWTNGVDRRAVAFPLWSGYECRTPAEAHEFVLWLFEGPEPVEILDAEGAVWPFYGGTVRAIWTRAS